MLKVYCLHTICDNSDMFRSILIIVRDWLNNNKSNIKVQGIINTLKFVHKMFVYIMKLGCSSAELVHTMRRL
jgi:hypothetical protein